MSAERRWDIWRALELARLEVTGAAYHAHEAMSCSQFLSAGLYTEDEAQWIPQDLVSPGESPSGDALDFGTVVHAAVYEQATLPAIVAVRPMKNGRALASNTAEFGAWALAHEGKIHMHPDDYATTMSCALAVHCRLRETFAPYAALEVLSTEQAYVVDEPITGMRIRIKPDRLRMDANGVVICEDLKTTSKRCSPAQFERTCRDFNYWRRAAFYRYALRLITGADATCTMLVVEKSPPHGVALYEMRSRMDEAEAQNDQTLRAIRRCIDAGDWQPAWTKGIFAI